MAKSAGSISINFKNEESSGGGRVRVPEGDYGVKVKSVKSGTSSSDNPMLTWEFVGTTGKLKGKGIRDYTTLTNKSLWKVRSILEALGMEVEGKAINFKPADVIGKELAVTVEDDEYEGKISSKIQDYIDLETFKGGGVADDGDDEDEPEDDEDEETVEDDEEDEDDEDDAPDPLADLDRTELKKELKKVDADAKVKKSMSDDDIRDLIRAASDDDDDEDLEEMDLEEL